MFEVETFEDGAESEVWDYKVGQSWRSSDLRPWEVEYVIAYGLGSLWREQAKFPCYVTKHFNVGGPELERATD